MRAKIQIEEAKGKMKREGREVTKRREEEEEEENEENEDDDENHRISSNIYYLERERER